ncbi:aromatic ring-hydroxylating dioxygenase subunit alpha [Myxococcota bacterium]|nr:aromatic ring-hydroxylating dioxygenase subunit alpha [Myxococcota bacterium]
MAIEPLQPMQTDQGARSTGLSYQGLLDTDTREVPEVLRMQSAREMPVVQVPIERYISQEFYDLEVEKVWKKTWQFACREEEIPESGDHTLYKIADLEILVVRGEDRQIRAFHNTCLHRGRPLKDYAGNSESIRCPFHGWHWNLDGSLREIPCRWDFPHVDREKFHLPEVRSGTWGGFVFVNPDPDCVSLETYLGDLPRHFERWPLEDRYTEVHVAKVLPCNWKVNQEAFMEAYHVIGTHPQMLPGIGDSNSQYDAWDNFSRAITANMTPSPHLTWEPDEQDQLGAMLTPSMDKDPQIRVPEDMTARELMAQMTRMQLQASVPSVQALTDAELVDSFYYTLFPNFHPWGAYNRIVYRFRPWEDDVHKCLMEVIYLSPYRGRRPSAVPIQWLDEDEPWTEAKGLGSLAKVFEQDTFNLRRAQQGLRSAQHTHVTLANYQETKLRHFHSLLERYVGA